MFDHIVDLDELADLISQRVNNPITIEDMNHRLLAYSKHGHCNDQARMETIMGRRVPETVLNRLWQDGVIQELMGCDDPIRIQAKNEVGLGNRVAISIRKGQSVLGYIWVQEINEWLGDEEMIYLRQAARAAMPRLHQRQTKRRLQEEKGKEFFWEILLGNIISHHEIQTKAEDIGIRLPKPFSIFTFEADSSDYESVQKELTYLLANLKDSFSLTQFPLAVTDQKRLIVMGGGGGKKVEFHTRCNTFVEEVNDRLQERFGDFPIQGTFGQAYDSFSQARTSYHQALSVLRMKKNLPEETRGILGYADLGIYRLLPTFVEKSESEGYSNYRLERLMKYDLENQSNLLETLEVYLDFAGRINLTAGQLHIHPNTLAYRLKRISEVAGLDLDDPNQRISMYLDLKMMKFTNS
ncbi:CdaR family transcriptional regulator [Ammoniphilus sp. CFH 90114]|uniref:PucR family transcriptional regulator n=1 Tax=Ammoniphilus sp. CFH 90114 TaxID=2493665 RepID=UPI00100EE95F|nr:helix-turn-helix domain-containing protein [Ammoniphilus sp. CFH 90114]RXT05696.1 PucR family transcriptional regulator [Ammoniphilus sp. CFH 90114]